MSSGQVFRWRQQEDQSWIGVDGASWFRVRQVHEADGIRMSVESNVGQDGFRSLFQLEVSLSSLEGNLIRLGPELEGAIRSIPGLRLMRPSDPEETLLSFLCTPNNNLRRITAMIGKLADFGEPLAEVGGTLLRRFPSVGRVAALHEGELRQLGFGYRSRVIVGVARALAERESGWLKGLRDMPHSEAHRLLCEFRGIGPKLADCIALFALHHSEAVPVDTHLWQAACSTYFPELSGKALTDQRYRMVGDHFRSRFGSLAGWAHQYLFYDHLRGSGTRVYTRPA